MKFKYYLRGLGMGILFTAIVLSLAGTNDEEKLTDEEIIERAKDLGMVMDDSKDSLFPGEKDSAEDTSDTETDTHNTDEEKGTE